MAGSITTISSTYYDPVRNEREDSQVVTRLSPRRCTGAADGLAQGLQGLLDRVQRDGAHRIALQIGKKVDGIVHIWGLRT